MIFFRKFYLSINFQDLVNVQSIYLVAQDVETAKVSQNFREILKKKCSNLKIWIVIIFFRFGEQESTIFWRDWRSNMFVPQRVSWNSKFQRSQAKPFFFIKPYYLINLRPHIFFFIIFWDRDDSNDNKLCKMNIIQRFLCTYPIA